MITIPWYYMWSDKYRFFHELFQHTMKEPFDVRPIYIEQEIFDKGLDGAKGHVWNNCLIKVDQIIAALESAEHPYILFTDVDLVVARQDIYEKLQSHIDARHSMVFLQEGHQLNIGFMLFMVCKEVVDFWKTIRARVVAKGGLDQAYVNEEIRTWPLPWGVFDKQFTCSNTWDRVTPFSVLQPLSSCLGKESDFAEKVFCASLFLDVTPFLHHVPQNILPHIAKIQSLSTYRVEH